MKKRRYSQGEELPLGLSMCMAQNPYAYGCFAKLSNEERRSLISKAEKARDLGQINDMVSGMVDGTESQPNFYRGLM